VNRRTSADLAVIGARIRTLDPERPRASALAVRDGTLIAVGDDAAVRDACDARTEVLDLRGTHVTPGLIDSHSHPFVGSLGAVGADLTGLRRLDDVLAALAAERRRCGDGAWVRGFALAYEAFEGVGIRGDVIAEAVQGSPAYLQFFDFHTALATPAALAMAGVDGPRTFDEGAEIVCIDGRPTGELRESAAFHLVERAIPEPTSAERLELYRRTLSRMNATGLAGACVMLGWPALFDEIRELEARGDLTMRVWVPLEQPPGVTDDEVAAHLALRDEGGRRWRAGVAKFFIDGVVEPGTSWLYEPDTAGGSTHPFWPSEQRYAEVVGRFIGADFQIATHAVGDRAVRAALDAYRAGAPPTGHHRIEHIETLQDHDLPRFAAEGVAASLQPLHMENMSGDQSDLWSRMLGPERCERAFRTRDLADSGAIVALGSDWPVARFDPRRGMGWARLRREPGEPEQMPYVANQALAAIETLHGYTTAPARIVGEADRSGMIRPGYRADLSGFAGDPVETDADALPDLPVTLTVVDGEIVHHA
jgi:predicted amidohydrolase YtcJ